MKKYIYFVILLFISCSEDNTLHFTARSIEIHECDSCPKVEIHLPVAEGKKKMAQLINDSLQKQVIELLNFQEDGAFHSLDEAVAGFLQEYRTIKEEFPDAIVGWEAEIDGEVGTHTPELISMAIKAYLFTGGAHGYSTTRYLNFNAKNGEKLQLADLIVDETGLLEIAERTFRTIQEIPANASINSTGFMFEGESYHLPENIGFSDRGMLLHYNSYEIASYADGPIEILIPYPALKTVLKPTYQP